MELTVTQFNVFISLFFFFGSVFTYIMCEKFKELKEREVFETKEYEELL